MSQTPARAIVVDPYPLFVHAIQTSLDRVHIAVLRQYHTLDELTSELDKLKPDLLIVGPHFGENCLVACRETNRRCPSVKIILFTVHADEPLFQADAAYAGVAACVFPILTDEQFLADVQKVLAGQQFFSHEILALAFQPIELTARECTVLNLMAEGKSDRQIADTLNDAKTSTVRNHSQHILEKLQVHRREQAVWRARHRGLI